jgi:hypothetical protein
MATIERVDNAIGAIAVPLVDRRLSAVALRERAPLLRLSEIRPGDVLLTRGRKAHSAAIAAVTQGRYSHAAIWLPMKDFHFGYQLSESDGMGVGWTPLHLFSANLEGEHTEQVVAIPGGAARAAVLRHPALEKFSAADLQDASARLQDREFFRSYTNFSRLPAAARLSGGRLLISQSLLALADRRRDPNRRAGTFCSEFVAMFFQELGIPLFKIDLRPEQVTPNDLAGQDSLLCRLQRVVVVASAISDSAYGYAPSYPSIERSTFLLRLVQESATAELVGRRVDEMLNMLHAQNAKSMLQIRRNAEHCDTTIMEKLQIAYQFGFEQDVMALQRISALNALIKGLSHRVENASSELYAECSDDERIFRRDVFLLVSHITIDALPNVSDGLFRIGLHQLMRIWRMPPPAKRMFDFRRWFSTRRDRAKVLRIVREYRRDQRQSKDLVRSINSNNEGLTEALASARAVAEAKRIVDEVTLTTSAVVPG